MPIKKTKTVKAKKSAKRAARVPMVTRLRDRAALAKKKALARLVKTKAKLTAARAALREQKKYGREATRLAQRLSRKIVRIRKTVA